MAINYKAALLALLALAGLAAVTFTLRFRVSREQWLAGQSLAEQARLASAPESDPLTQLAYGEKLARSNDPRGAQQAYQAAARRLEPGQRDALAARVAARLGYELAFMGDSERARTYLDRARQIDSRNWLIGLGEGMILLHQHDAKHAVEQFRQAVSAQSRSYEAHYLLGLAFNDNREPEAAERELKTAIALAPEFAPAHAELGHAYGYRSLYQPAAEQFREARRLDPKNTDYLYALGEALGQGARTPEEYREAAAAQEECLRTTPSNGALLYTLGQLHLRFLNLDQAIRSLRRASEIRPNHANTWYNLARAVELEGKTEEARRYYSLFEQKLALHDRAIAAEKQVAANKRDPFARLELARSFHAAGNWKGCYTQLKAALTLRPDLTEAQSELSRLQTEFQQLLDQTGGMAESQQESNPTGPPLPDATVSSTAGDTAGTQP